MFDEPEDLCGDLSTDHKLRAGLNALTVPETSPDFNSRILTELRKPQSWRNRLSIAGLRPTLRPVVSSAVCGLVVMLALLRWTTRMPIPMQLIPADRGISVKSIDGKMSGVLDNADLSGASLSSLPMLPAVSPLSVDRGMTAPVTPPVRRDNRDRHSQLPPSNRLLGS